MNFLPSAYSANGNIPFTPDTPISGRLVQHMHDIIETSERTASAASTLRPAEMAWQTPESTVVETALEVTAYSLSTR